jgi:hypothetical protein
MPDPQWLLNKWFTRKRLTLPESASTTPGASKPLPANNLGACWKFTRHTATRKFVVNNLTLALSLTKQVAEIVQVVPYVGPAAELLSNMIELYKAFFAVLGSLYRTDSSVFC